MQYIIYIIFIIHFFRFFKIPFDKLSDCQNCQIYSFITSCSNVSLLIFTLLRMRLR